MRLLRAVLVVLDLVSLVNLLTGPGPIVDNLRALALAFAALAAVVVVFVVAVFAIGILAQRDPPYLT